MAKFDTVFRGYDKQAVDSYINDITTRYDNALASQKDRIFSLVDENGQLKEKLQQYIVDEQAISKSLVESQKLASELKYDAEKYSRLVLTRAKVFYATWQSYAKTLLATLTDAEVKQFNALADKVRQLIDTYEGDGTTTTMLDNVVATSTVIPTQESKPTANPIERVQQAAGAVIDPKEIIETDQTLEELCRELGLID